MNSTDLFAFLKSEPTFKLTLAKRVIKLERSKIEDVLGRTDLPNEYYELLAIINHLEVLGPEDIFHFLSFEDVQLINDDPAYTSYVPEMFFFADNAGEHFYAFDPENQWGKGVNAIFLISTGTMKKEFSSFVGNDFFEVLLKMKNGISFTELPWLDESE